MVRSGKRKSEVLVTLKAVMDCVGAGSAGEQAYKALVNRGRLVINSCVGVTIILRSFTGTVWRVTETTDAPAYVFKL